MQSCMRTLKSAGSPTADRLQTKHLNPLLPRESELVSHASGTSLTNKGRKILKKTFCTVGDSGTHSSRVLAGEMQRAWLTVAVALACMWCASGLSAWEEQCWYTPRAAGMYNTGQVCLRCASGTYKTSCASCPQVYFVDHVAQRAAPSRSALT